MQGPPDDTYDASDIDAVNERKRSAGSREKADRDAMAMVLQDARMRAFFWDLLVDCNMFAASYSGDALAMAFSEGQRNVGLRIFSLIQRAAPDLYMAMVRENVKDTRNG